VHGRQYFACAVCRLVHLAPDQRPARAAESARYRTHQNDPVDPRYREFLNRLAAPLVERLPAAAQGLDYGSGPGPTLSVMLEALGFTVALYDPVFAPEEAALGRTYDFITCSETAEHFFDPGREFARLNTLLRPGGWLAVMTEMRQEGRSFAEWRYVRDLTHVCFYHPATMTWLADRFDWSLDSPRPNVALFRKG
jgi:SAM-dependent methyltransferase